MWNRVMTGAVCAILMLAANGCLFDTTLNAKGGGEMTLQYRVSKDDTADKQRAALTSSNVTIVDFKFDDKTREVSAKVKFDDITKLSTAKFFQNVGVTKSPGKDKDTETIAVKIVNKHKMALPDSAIEYFGKDVTISTTVPGAVVASNATETKDKTVTWKFLLKEFVSLTEVPLTVTYKKG
jgi:hypothetical protein